MIWPLTYAGVVDALPACYALADFAGSPKDPRTRLQSLTERLTDGQSPPRDYGDPEISEEFAAEVMPRLPSPPSLSFRSRQALGAPAWSSVSCQKSKALLVGRYCMYRSSGLRKWIAWHDILLLCMA
jgi:hypothetical protein